jgi:hypothetical protein
MNTFYHLLFILKAENEDVRINSKHSIFNQLTLYK